MFSAEVDLLIFFIDDAVTNVHVIDQSIQKDKT